MSDKEPLLNSYCETCSSNSSDVLNARTRVFLTDAKSVGFDKSKDNCHTVEGLIVNQPKFCIKIVFIAATWGFLTNVERAIILPTMWLYFNERWGSKVSETYYGPTLGAFSLSILIATPLFGYAGHANFRVRFLLIIANILEIIGNIIYLIAQQPWMLFVGRLIAGIGASCESPMYADLIRTTTVNERTSCIILLLLSRQVGLLIGPIFTLVIHKMDLHVLNLSINVYNGPGLVMACLWLLHSVFILFLYPSINKFIVPCANLNRGAIIVSEDSSKIGDGRTSTSILPKLRFKNYIQYEILTIYASVFAAYFCSMGLEAVLSPVADTYFKWNEVQLSYIYIGASILIIVAAGTMHLLSKNFEDRKLLLTGLIILFFTYVYLTFILSILSSLNTIGSTLVVTGVALHVVGIPFPLAISESLYSKLIPVAQSDQAQTILRTIINIAYLLGPFTGGTLQGKPMVVFLVMLAIVSIPLLMLILRFSFFKVPMNNEFSRQDMPEQNI